MYVRSKLDYGAPVYNSASQTLLRTLDTVSTEAIRIAVGAFRSTPVTSLYTLVNEMTLQERRDYLTLRYYLKIRGNPGNPATAAVFSAHDDLLFRHRGIHPSVGPRIRLLMDAYQLERVPILPAFSYTLLNLTIPTYTLPVPSINFELNSYPKSVTPSAQYLQLYQQLCNTMFAEFHHVYTDGFK